ncbi:CoA-binding protein [Candidatus Micrarchaeota archaeon]|nr:CoA-binding protein [Candidatus Micrarchaeota archaeon]
MDILAILKNSKTIAVVGLSDKPDRPSFAVATYLLDKGYRIIPVNPNIKEWRGIKAYPSLITIPKSEQIDVVDIFRKSEDVEPIVDDAINIRAKVIWMQLGILNNGAAKKATDKGLIVVMDKCMKIEHSKFFSNSSF